MQLFWFGELTFWKEQLRLHFSIPGPIVSPELWRFLPKTLRLQLHLGTPRAPNFANFSCIYNHTLKSVKNLNYDHFGADNTSTVASVRFGYCSCVGRFGRFRFSVPMVPLEKFFFCFNTVLTERDGSGSGFGFWKTVLMVPVPLSVSGSGAAKRGGFKRRGFPNLDLSFLFCPCFVFFCPFPIFPGFSRFVRGWSENFPDLSFSSFSSY